MHNIRCSVGLIALLGIGCLSSDSEPSMQADFYVSVKGDPRLGKQMLEKQQRDGIDSHSLAVDPLFVDPANGDFRLKPDSPALKLGFVPFDMSKVGLVD